MDKYSNESGIGIGERAKLVFISQEYDVVLMIVCNASFDIDREYQYNV